MHQPIMVIVSSTTFSQMQVQIGHSLAHLQDIIPVYHLYIFKPAKVGIKSCGCAKECLFVHTFDHMPLS